MTFAYAERRERALGCAGHDTTSRARVAAAVDTLGVSTVESPAPASRWTRWPLRVGAAALLVVAVVFGYNGVLLLADALDKYENRDGWGYAYMLYGYVGVGALFASSVLLVLAVVAFRDNRWWAIASITTGAVFPLAIGWYLYGREDDGAAFYLAVGAVMVACALLAAATQPLRARSGRTAIESSAGSRPGDIPAR